MMADEQMKLIPKRLYDFLLGQDHFDGYFFGDWRDNQPFWWRKHLREAEDLTRPSTPPAVSDDLVLIEVERDADGNVMSCTGCGTVETVRSIRAHHPTAFTCCPERKMVSIQRREQQAAEAMKERCAAYVEGAGGAIPGAAVFAGLVSGNNQPCMSGDMRDRINPHTRRRFDDATQTLATAIRSLTTEVGEGKGAQ